MKLENILEYEVYKGYVEITGCDESVEGEIIIPEKIQGLPVTKIGDNALFNCSSLKNVVIPDHVTEIGSCAFFCCSALESVIIPDCVTKIGNNAFSDCSALRSVTLPAHITDIRFNLFYGCHSLQSVLIPAHVTSIWGDAFSGCSSLRAVIIQNPDCEIEEDDNTISSTAVIYGYPNSTAQAYAEEFNREFIALKY